MTGAVLTWRLVRTWTCSSLWCWSLNAGTCTVSVTITLSQNRSATLVWSGSGGGGGWDVVFREPFSHLATAVSTPMTSVRATTTRIVGIKSSDPQSPSHSRQDRFRAERLSLFYTRLMQLAVKDFSKCLLKTSRSLRCIAVTQPIEFRSYTEILG